MIAAGVNAKALSAYMGHSSVEVTFLAVILMLSYDWVKWRRANREKARRGHRMPAPE
jgi:hypothetical protein